MHGTGYYHKFERRIRIRVPEIKGSPAMAGELESRLAKLDGVAHTQANPLTGYVLVLFDDQVVSYYHVFAVINDLKCLDVEAAVSPGPQDGTSGVVRRST